MWYGTVDFRAHSGLCLKYIHGMTVPISPAFELPKILQYQRRLCPLCCWYDARVADRDVHDPYDSAGMAGDSVEAVDVRSFHVEDDVIQN